MSREALSKEFAGSPSFLVIYLVWTKLGQPCDYSKLLGEGSTLSDTQTPAFLVK